jgi:hypothetical protein
MEVHYIGQVVAEEELIKVTLDLVELAVVAVALVVVQDLKDLEGGQL